MATHGEPQKETPSSQEDAAGQEALLEQGDPIEPQRAQRFSLKKEVSLINGICIVVGIIIGSGIFISPTGVLRQTGSVGLALLVWLGAGIVAIGGLGTSILKSGAEYVYLMEAFGPLPAFLFAWTTVLIIQPSSRSIMAITFAQYVVKPVYPDCDPPPDVLKLVACVVLGKRSVDEQSVTWRIFYHTSM